VEAQQILNAYQGIGQFGPAYEAMYRRDTHAPGSVDRVLLSQMVRVCPETLNFLYADPPSRPNYVTFSRPQLESSLESLATSGSSVEGIVQKVASYCHDLAGIEDAPMVFGGTEEEICARGTDWCTDLTRVACVLLQIAGAPARIVTLADLSRAYMGHSVVEAWRDDSWGVVDPVSGRVYRAGSGEPASVWQLMTDRDAIRANWKTAEDVAHWTGQFSAAAISEYLVADASRYDYSTSAINGYYESILAQSSEGWLGGLRWLHGEDS
jgi:Transglutaminase-like superfamily